MAVRGHMSNLRQTYGFLIDGLCSCKRHSNAV